MALAVLLSRGNATASAKETIRRKAADLGSKDLLTILAHSSAVERKMTGSGWSSSWAGRQAQTSPWSRPLFWQAPGRCGRVSKVPPGGEYPKDGARLDGLADPATVKQKPRVWLPRGTIMGRAGSFDCDREKEHSPEASDPSRGADRALSGRAQGRQGPGREALP